MDNKTKAGLAGAGSGAAAGATAGAYFANPWTVAIGAAAGGIIGGLTSYFGAEAADDAANAANEAYNNASIEKQNAIKALMKKLGDNWQTPEYNQSEIYNPNPLTAQEYTLLREFSPQIAQFVEEARPQMVTEAKSQTEIDIQKDALQQFQQLSSQPDQVAKMETDLATERAKQGLASQRANILRQYASKGLGGTSQELLAQISSVDSQEKMAREEGLKAALAQRQRQLEALRSSATLAGDIRSANRQTETANVDAINRFNERASMRKQTYDQYVAGLKNEAQLTNIANQQKVADANIAQKNQMNLLNRERQDRIARERREREDRIAREQAESANELLRTQTGLEKDLYGTAYDTATSAAERQAKGDIASAAGTMQMGQQAIGMAKDAAAAYKGAKKKNPEDLTVEEYLKMTPDDF